MGSQNLTSRLSGRKPSQRNTPLPAWVQRAQANALPVKVIR